MTDKPFPRVLFPDEKANSVDDIDYERLVSSGIKAIIFDLDNTLALWGEDELEQEIVDLFDFLTSIGLRVGIMSNTKRQEIQDFVLKLPFPHLFNANKPRSKGFKLMLDKLGVSAEKTVMVGDQLFTDVLGANRLDIYTIRVDPLDTDHEYRLTKINRIGERFLLRLRRLYRFLRQLPKVLAEW